MVNLEDYKRKKGMLPKEDYGTIFVFKSDPDGVSEIIEHLILDVRKSARRTYPLPEVDKYEYKLKEGPYSVEMYADQEYGVEQHLCSTFGGDPWTASTWCSKNPELLEDLRTKELERIKTYYKQ
jgi:hypothetical protein